MVVSADALAWMVLGLLILVVAVFFLFAGHER